MRNGPRNSLVDLGEVIQNGIVFNLRNWNDAGVQMQNLPETVERLFALLETRKIEYALVGGLAMLQYVEGRNTQDIDLILAPESLAQLPELQLTARENDFARAQFSGVQVDFLFASHPLFKKVLVSYSEIQPFKNRKIRCATVQGMLLLKLYALPPLYRQGDLGRAAIYESDIYNLILTMDKPIDDLFDVLQAHFSQADLAETRKIVQELRQREGRFGGGPGAE